jgi:hypothetical protein
LSKNYDVKERSRAYREHGTIINKVLTDHYGIQLNYNVKEINKAFALKSTVLLKSKILIPLSTKPNFKIGPMTKVDDEDDQEMMEEIMGEVDLGDDCPELLDENEENITKYNKKAVITKEIYSCYQGEFGGSPLLSNVSDKLIMVMKSSIPLKISKKIREQNIRAAIITPETAALNGLPEIYHPILYTTDNGSDYLKSLKAIPINSLIKNFRATTDEKYTEFGEGTLESHIEKILKEQKIEAEVEVQQVLDEMSKKMKDVGYDLEEYNTIKEKVTKGEGMDSMLKMLIGKIVHTKGFDLKKQMIKLLKEQTNRDVLERMTVIPKALGGVITNLPPISKPLISNLKLRAEMNCIAPNLADNLPSGRFMLTPEVKMMVTNSLNVVLADEEHPLYDKMNVIGDVLTGLSNDALTAVDSVHSDNEGMLKILNSILIMYSSQSKKTKRSKRVIPGGDIKYTALY